MLRKKEGITLIALVITIIVLLILAGVTLSLVSGENGILKRATNAVDVNEKASAQEEANLLIADIAMQYYEEKYVNDKADFENVDDYIKKELKTEKETEGGYKVKYNEETGKIEVSNNKLISSGPIVNGKVDWSGEPQKTLKPIIKNIKTQITTTSAKISVELENEKKLTYGIRKEGETEDRDRFQEETNRTTLEHEFTGLEQGKNYIITIEAENEHGKTTETVNVTTRLTPRNKWNLGEENSDFITYQGTPDYRGKEEGVYLQNTVLMTKENYTLNSTYSIVLETRDIQPNGRPGFMIGFGGVGSGVGARFLGISNDIIGDANYYVAYTGAGDNYTHYWITDENFVRNAWHIVAVKYDGTKFSLFIDGEEKASSTGSTIKNTPLYIGGANGSGTTSAGLNWGWGNGYYRNLAIYNGALTDEELANYSF